MKTYFPHLLQNIGVWSLTILFIAGGLIAPGAHRLAHTAHDLEMLFPACDTTCNDHQTPDADETGTSGDGGGDAPCSLCKLSTLGMDMPVLTVQPVTAVAPCPDIEYAQIRMDALPSMPPSARGPPA